MQKRKWLMPVYYKDFHCKCEKCRHSCCHTWKIPISEKEYYHLIGMECSPELHDRLEIAFVDPEYKSTDHFKFISFNWLGDCPMQKDGLCMIHAEQGEEHLPRICRLYPRSLKEINGNLWACCSSSCEKVVELLYEMDCFTLVEDELAEEAQIKVHLEDDAIQQIQQYQKIMKDRSISLKDSIQKVCEQVNFEEFSKEYQMEKNPIEEGLSLLNRFASSDQFFGQINKELQNRYFDNWDQFNLDKKDFEKRYPNWMNFFENVLNNSLLYENFPFVDSRFKQTNAYKGLCVSYGLLRLICIGYTSIHKSKEDLIDCVAELFHLIDHTAFYYNVNAICDNAANFLKI